jgi:hypothetical protein
MPRLHEHALQSIFAFSSLPDLHSAGCEALRFVLLLLSSAR